MDKELLKLYAEYERYNSELPGLRNEYNFLVEDIDNKNRELSNIKRQSDNIKQGNASAYSELEKAKEQTKIDIENMKQEAIKKLESEKTKEMSEIQQYISEKNKLIADNKELEDKRKELEKSILDNTKLRDTIKEEYIMYKSLVDENIKLEKQEQENTLKLKQDTEIKIKALENKEQEYKERYPRYENEKNILAQETKKLQIIRNNIELDRKKQEEDKKTIEIGLQSLSKEKLETQKLIDEQLSIKQENETKLIDIKKTITDFQEEKYRFFVLMKSKEINKKDLKSLEDNFNIDG